MPAPTVSVVIATYDRDEGCRRAVASVLAQDPSPLEVLICDNGSDAVAEASLRSLATEDRRLRYLRIEANAGTPAPARNLGIERARGHWVAFLDDDDRWLPGKLAAQMTFMETNAYDVVASDAVRTSGDRYFGPRGGPVSPDRTTIEDANPVITSTAVVRKRAVLDVGGFETERWIVGVEDYDLWLRLADRGARFVVLDEPLALYEDGGSARLSAARARTQVRLARLKWHRVRTSPLDGVTLRSALFESAHAILALAKGARDGASARWSHLRAAPADPEA